MTQYPFSATIPTRPSSLVHQAISDVSELTLVPVKDILSHVRKKNICHARHLAIWLMRFKYKMTQEKIAIEFNRDHTTVVHSCHVVRDEWNSFKDEIATLT